MKRGCTEIPFMLGEAASRHVASGRERGGAGDMGSPAADACMLNPVQLLAEATVRYALS